MKRDLNGISLIINIITNNITAKSLKELIIIIIFFVLSLLFVFLYGTRMGLHSSTAWLTIIAISFLEDLLLFEPLGIMFLHITVASFSYEDIIALTHRVFRSMFTLRVRGQMEPIKSKIQHVNAACRAARQFPHLYASRLLSSLNDSDMPNYFIPYDQQNNLSNE